MCIKKYVVTCDAQTNIANVNLNSWTETSLTVAKETMSVKGFNRAETIIL